MVQTATNTFYNREQEREAKAQARERRKETRHAKMLAALQGSPMANPKSLKDRAQDKCLICRQRNIAPKSVQIMGSFLKCLITKVIIWDMGGSLSSGPKSLKVMCQALPHDGSTGLKRPAPSSPPVTDNHHGAGNKAATGCGREV